MLTALNISNIVLIEKLNLEFGAGLNVLTGETGAGKSILLDALSLALGSRSDVGLIRHGCDMASVTAEFDCTPNAVRNILAALHAPPFGDTPAQGSPFRAGHCRRNRRELSRA